MRELLATTFTGIVVDENEQFYFVQKNGITFRLKKEEGTHAIGEAVEGFGYLNQKQEPALTTTIPTVRIGSYGFGTVTGTRRDLGVFVDVGLPDNGKQPYLYYWKMKKIIYQQKKFTSW